MPLIPAKRAPALLKPKHKKRMNHDDDDPHNNNNHTPKDITKRHNGDRLHFFIYGIYTKFIVDY